MINEELAKLIPETGVILILGERGSGKSVLAYSILEYFYNKRNLFVFRFPRPEILPSFIQVTYDPDFPDGGIVLVDEAYITFSARKAMSRKNKFIDMLNGLARQKDLLVIYITQDSTRVDVNIIRSADVLMIKRLSKRQVEFERKELKSWLKKVKEAIDRIGSLEEIRRSVYVDSDIFGKEFSGIVRNCITLPGFWSEEISKAWSGVSLNTDMSLDMLLKEMKKRKILVDASIETGRFKIVDGLVDETIRQAIERHKKELIRIFDGRIGEGYKILES